MKSEISKSHINFFREQAQKQPDYSLGVLAYMWRGDIIRKLNDAGKPPKTTEIENILQSCQDRIFKAIESGELKAHFPENKILPERRTTSMVLLAEEHRIKTEWIIETKDYIQWGKANNAGPEDLILDVEKENLNDDTSNQANEDKPLDERERQTLLAIIAALCKRSGISPNDRGLAKELHEQTILLECEKSEKAIKSHLNKAATLFE